MGAKGIARKDTNSISDRTLAACRCLSERTTTCSERTSLDPDPGLRYPAHATFALKSALNSGSRVLPRTYTTRTFSAHSPSSPGGAISPPISLPTTTATVRAPFPSFTHAEFTFLFCPYPAIYRHRVSLTSRPRGHARTRPAPLDSVGKRRAYRWTPAKRRHSPSGIERDDGWSFSLSLSLSLSFVDRLERPKVPVWFPLKPTGRPLVASAAA